MSKTKIAGLLLLLGSIAGCGTGEPYSTPVAEPVEREVFPDPAPAVADEVKTAVEAWVAERVDADGVFDIPARGGRDVAGRLSEFHTVRQADADTYTVCVNFKNGDDVYDVDVFVDRGPDGLAIRDAYLHKINGEVISG